MYASVPCLTIVLGQIEDQCFVDDVGRGGGGGGGATNTTSDQARAGCLRGGGVGEPGHARLHAQLRVCSIQEVD